MPRAPEEATEGKECNVDSTSANSEKASPSVNNLLFRQTGNSLEIAFIRETDVFVTASGDSQHHRGLLTWPSFESIPPVRPRTVADALLELPSA